jgi:hypothetical protein
MILTHFKEKSHFKKIKEGEKKYKFCFQGKVLSTFLAENYKISKEESLIKCQEIQDEGYIFELKSDQRFLLDHQYYITNHSLISTFLNSKILHEKLTDLLDENLFLIELLLNFNDNLGSKALLKLIANYLESKNFTQLFLQKVNKKKKNLFSIQKKILFQKFKSDEFFAFQLFQVKFKINLFSFFFLC